MIFWLLDVKSNVNVNGKVVGFDYINTYYDYSDAFKAATELCETKDVLDVSIHKWILKDDGTQDHSEDSDSIPFHFQKSWGDVIWK